MSLKVRDLNKDLFESISRFVPIPCVELIIKNKKGQVLFTWRDDDVFGQGWHVPGGAIRLNEKIEERLERTAQGELRVGVKKNFKLIGVEQLISEKRTIRRHHICFIYSCSLVKNLPGEQLYKAGGQRPKIGQYKWFDSLPDNVLEEHKGYGKYF